MRIGVPRERMQSEYRVALTPAGGPGLLTLGHEVLVGRGAGVPPGGVSGVRPARVVVLGCGTAGRNAAWLAAGMEAEVLLLDKNIDRLREVDSIHRGRIMTLYSTQEAVEDAVRIADLVVGAVLVPGARAPVLGPEGRVREREPGGG